MRPKELLDKASRASQETYGAPRLHVELAEAHGLRVSRCGRRRVLRSLAETEAALDLVRRRFTASAPDELWVADSTYVPTWEGWLSLGAVMDVFTKRVVGCSMRRDLKALLVVDALVPILPAAQVTGSGETLKAQRSYLKGHQEYAPNVTISVGPMTGCGRLASQRSAPKRLP